MISLSSIVKAKQLVTDSSAKPPEQSNPLPEISFGVIEQSSLMEINELKESTLKEAYAKAKQIEAEAQERADSLLEDALRKSREIIDGAEKKGYENGYLRGLVDGANASEIAAEEGLAELGKMLDIFGSEQRKILERNEKDLIEIAFELAKKIMKQHIQTDENAVHKMLEEIIMENETSYKIYFSEYQKTLDIHIDKSIAKKLRNLTKEAKLVFIKEEDLIMSENEGGIVDMSVPVQLEQLKKAVDHAH